MPIGFGGPLRQTSGRARSPSYLSCHGAAQARWVRSRASSRWHGRPSRPCRIRVPPEQHRELAIRAAEEGVSLNRYLCSLLSIAQGARVVATKVDSEGNVVD